MNRFGRDGHFARLYPRQVEHVVHQGEEMGACILHMLHPLELFRRQRLGGIQAQELRKSDHRVQRCSQFVAHAREEFGLCPVRCLQCFVSPPLGVRRNACGDVPKNDRGQNFSLHLQSREGRLDRKALSILLSAGERLERPRA